MRFLICSVLFVLLNVSIAFAQSAPSTSLENQHSFVLFITPMSEEDRVIESARFLMKEGYQINVSDFDFTNEGLLRSFSAEISNDCTEGAFTYSGITDFTPGIYPVAVLFTAPNCSTGAFTTTVDQLEPLLSVIFEGKDSDHILHTWEGTLDDIKDMTFDLK